MGGGFPGPRNVIFALGVFIHRPPHSLEISQGSPEPLTGRELLTPDEVMRLGPEHPIVLVRGERPYLLDRLNYLADAEYAGRFDANPYHS